MSAITARRIKNCASNDDAERGIACRTTLGHFVLVNSVKFIILERTNGCYFLISSVVKKVRAEGMVATLSGRSVAWTRLCRRVACADREASPSLGHRAC